MSSVAMATSASGAESLFREAVRRVRAVSPVAAWVASATVVMGVLALVAAVAGPERVILGTNGWLKPAKFAGSFGLYALTALWLLSFVESRGKWVRFIALGTAWGCLVEGAGATLQAARGTTSHFNVSTPFDRAVYLTMAGSISVVMVTAIGLTILLAVQKRTEPVFRTGLTLGIAVTFVGMLAGVPMVIPSTEQIAAGPDNEFAGARTVGVEAGGPGLPLVNWSLEGGDLRVPHAAGLHGAQLMPLLAWVLSRRRSRLQDRHQKSLLWTAALVQVGLVVVLLAQALRGESIISPSPTIFGLLLAVLTAGGVAVARTFIEAHAGDSVDRKSLIARVANGMTWFIAIAHGWVFAVETFLWETEVARNMFQVPAENAPHSAWVAQNLGLYNGFLAAGLIWGLTREDARQSLAIKTFFLSVIAIAGVFGSQTFTPGTIVAQTAVSVVALFLQGFAHRDPRPAATS